jgi:outer membrane protein OmpA-like peptidoglycan-associated protein
MRTPHRLAPLALVAAIAACTTLPERDAALEQARIAHDSARNDPNVQRYAAAEYARADETYRAADAAWRNDDPARKVDHLAYLAQRRAELAIETGREKASEDAVARARADRDRVRADAASRSAAIAQQQATDAQIRANASATQAAAARQQAYAAQQQANLNAANAEAYRQQAATVDAQNRDLQAQLAELQAQNTDHGMVITLGDVLFETGSANLREPGRVAVDRIATFLQRYPQRTVEIEGFTDNVGGPAYNQELSERRADAVRFALVDRGIAATRITARGYGMSSPIASNADATGRQMNRRVEVVISDAYGRIPPQPG